MNFSLGTNQIREGTLFENPSNNVVGTPSVFKVSRVFGTVNVFASGLVQGALTPVLWLGLVLEGTDRLDDGDDIPTVIERPNSNDDDANEEAWLWRQAFSLTKDALRGTATESYTTQVFDWQLRGGKGTTVAVGQRLTWVCQAVSSNSAQTAALSVEVQYLTLYG